MNSLADYAVKLNYPTAILARGGLLAMSSEESSTWRVEYELAHACSVENLGGLLVDHGAVAFKTYNQGYNDVHGFAFGNWLHVNFFPSEGRLEIEVNRSETTLFVQYTSVFERVVTKKSPELTVCGLRLAVSLADVAAVAEALGHQAIASGGGMVINVQEETVFALPFDGYVYLLGV